MAKTIRTFVAAPLSPEILKTADGIQQQLKQLGLKFRWVRPANIHLTIKFLGEIAFDRIAAATTALRHAAGQSQPVELTAQGLGVFPNIRRPRILWIGLGGEVDILRQIHETVEASFEAHGFARDDRSFKAHLTLARIQRSVEAKKLLQAIAEAGRFVTEPYRLDEMILFKSELRPGGAVYSQLSRAVLGAGEKEELTRAENDQ